MQSAVSQPFRVEGTGVIKAFSIFRGAVARASRSAKGLVKNATTLFAGTQLSRVDRTAFGAASSERTTLVAARKSPYE